MVYDFSSFMVDNVINCLDTGTWFLVKIILCRDYSLKYEYIDQRLVGQIGTKWECLFPALGTSKGLFFWEILFFGGGEWALLIYILCGNIIILAGVSVEPYDIIMTSYPVAKVNKPKARQYLNLLASQYH
ncbi:uncharacterized protein BJ212DRAFT_1592555 [Suillus subaureus]|uniref:Uncharacterized protein n=1 Tax=Suillus subaureus TaxID=48587 RepID=A0A9P7AT26_9AGAM|nr:uncharacterized protein BJ212DRAFT_1592555 [Suillus subaureus]KAG1794512.1 hypothetical protein BJ212DRAFT_1592555 [Suillus subaureus]